MGKIGKPRGQGNQFRGQCCPNNGHHEDNCHECPHEKKAQKVETLREKKGEDLVTLAIQDVEEHNKKSLRFKSKEH